MPTIHARHILVDTEEQAKEVLKRLGQGESFASLAEKYSKCPSGDRGGDLGEFRHGQIMASEFDEAAFSLKEGERTGPVHTEFGYHIIERYRAPMTEASP